MKTPDILKKIIKNPFVRNVTTLSAGTVISQAVVVLTSPLLARIYAVEAFGVLSVFSSFTSLLGVLATGRYEFAIVIPEKKDKAMQLVRLIISIGFVVALGYLCFIGLLKEIFGFHDSTGFLYSGGVYWAPLYIFFMATNTAFGYWILRNKRYKLYSLAIAIQVIVVTISSIVFGLLKIETGLIIALLIGSLVFTLFFLFKEPTIIADLRKSRELSIVAKEFSSFPKFKAFSDLALTASQQFVPVLLSVLYSTTIVGFYAMANRMLRLPSIVITNSIASVFRNDAMEEIRIKGNCKALYISTLKKLMWMALPIYLFLFFTSPFLFCLFFGKQWLTAGHYAQIIATFLLFEFLANPFNELFVLREKQRRYMILQGLNVSMGAAMLVVGMYLYKEAKWSLILFSANSIVFNFIFIINSYRIAKQQ